MQGHSQGYTLRDTLLTVLLLLAPMYKTGIESHDSNQHSVYCVYSDERTLYITTVFSILYTENQSGQTHKLNVTQ